MSTTFTINAELILVKMSCPNCAGQFAIDESYRKEAERAGGFKQCWVCPYCKVSRGYGESEVDRLNIQLREKDKRIESLAVQKEDARRERDHFRKSRDIVKGLLTKTKTRVGNGTCPCCNRSFTNLKRHMCSKHPDYAGSEIQK